MLEPENLPNRHGEEDAEAVAISTAAVALRTDGEATCADDPLNDQKPHTVCTVNEAPVSTVDPHQINELSQVISRIQPEADAQEHIDRGSLIVGCAA